MVLRSQGGKYQLIPHHLRRVTCSYLKWCPEFLSPRIPQNGSKNSVEKKSHPFQRRQPIFWSGLQQRRGSLIHFPWDPGNGGTLHPVLQKWVKFSTNFFWKLLFFLHFFAPLNFHPWPELITQVMEVTWLNPWNGSLLKTPKWPEEPGNFFFDPQRILKNAMRLQVAEVAPIQKTRANWRLLDFLGWNKNMFLREEVWRLVKYICWFIFLRNFGVKQNGAFFQQVVTILKNLVSIFFTKKSECLQRMSHCHPKPGHPFMGPSTPRPLTSPCEFGYD